VNTSHKTLARYGQGMLALLSLKVLAACANFRPRQF
jgi:hypothetical protein